jgi:hypothetical protein
MTDAHRWRTFLQTVLAAAIGAFIVLMVWMVVTLLGVVNSIEELVKEGNETTDKVRQTQKTSRSLLEYVNDCTKPQGECYQASEARDAEQVGKFNAAVIAAAWCASHHTDSSIRELTVCVGKRINGKKPR